MFKTYVIGRSDSADVTIADNTVSRLHLELTKTDTGVYYCVDRCSSQGSYILKQEAWVRFNQAFVRSGDTLKLGSKKIGFDRLIETLPNRRKSEPVRARNKVKAQAENHYTRMSIVPRRNAETGEVEDKGKS